jgi:AmmeMemoRadiSam system protein A
VDHIVGCALVPHPPILIPEIGRKNLREIEKTRQGMEKISAQVKLWNPDTLVVITPHGPVFRDAISIAAIPNLQGNFANFGNPDIRISADTDTEMVEAITRSAGQRGIAVLQITENSAKKYGLSVILDHGAMVPLYYLAKAGVKAKVVHVSIGWLEYEELFSFGRAVQEAGESINRRIVVICSGDLSHRLTPDAPAGYSIQARKFDEIIVRALEKLDVQSIRNLDPDFIEEAGECGLRPIYILLGILDGLKVKVDMLSYEGPFGVGYAVMQFKTGSEAVVEQQYTDKATGESSYTNLARRSLEHYVLTGKMLQAPDNLPRELSRRAGVFVSLKKQGHLRGCIGTFAPTRPNIAEEIISNAVNAGTGDPRFFPVEADELNELTYSVDILSEPEPIKNMGELDPKKYGVILRKGHRSGLLLPDLEGVDTVEEQISIAKQKAGINPEEPVEMYRFAVTRHK